MVRGNGPRALVEVCSFSSQETVSAHTMSRRYT